VNYEIGLLKNKYDFRVQSSYQACMIVIQCKDKQVNYCGLGGGLGMCMGTLVEPSVFLYLSFALFLCVTSAILTSYLS